MLCYMLFVLICLQLYTSRAIIHKLLGLAGIHGFVQTWVDKDINQSKQRISQERI